MWWAGVLLAIGAQFAGTLGNQAVRYAHDKRNSLPPAQRPKTVRMPVWWVGMVSLVVLNVGLNLAATAFAPVALLSPLAGLTVVLNSLLSPLFLNEKPMKHDYIAGVIVAGGVALSAVFGPRESPQRPVDELVALYANPVFLSVFIVVILWIIVLFVATRLRLRFPVFAKFAGPSIAGCLGGLVPVESQAAVLCIVQAFTGHDEVFEQVEPYLIVFFLLLTAILQLLALNAALSHYKTLYVVPIYQTHLIVLGSVLSLLYFQEQKNMPWNRLGLYALGIIVVISGVAYVSIAHHFASPPTDTIRTDLVILVQRQTDRGTYHDWIPLCLGEKPGGVPPRFSCRHLVRACRKKEDVVEPTEMATFFDKNPEIPVTGSHKRNELLSTAAVLVYMKNRYPDKDFIWATAVKKADDLFLTAVRPQGKIGFVGCLRATLCFCKKSEPDPEETEVVEQSRNAWMALGEKYLISMGVSLQPPSENGDETPAPSAQSPSSETGAKVPLLDASKKAEEGPFAADAAGGGQQGSKPSTPVSPRKKKDKVIGKRRLGTTLDVYLNGDIPTSVFSSASFSLPESPAAGVQGAAQAAALEASWMELEDSLSRSALKMKAYRKASTDGKTPRTLGDGRRTPGPLLNPSLAAFERKRRERIRLDREEARAARPPPMVTIGPAVTHVPEGADHNRVAVPTEVAIVVSAASASRDRTDVREAAVRVESTGAVEERTSRYSSSASYSSSNDRDEEPDASL